MKRIITLLALSAFLTTALSLRVKADGRVIPFSNLPQEAKSFIKEFFDGVKVLQVTSEWNEYEVIFADHSKVEFDKKGNWTDIKCASRGVPASIIPSKIASYAERNFPDEIIIEIERSRWGYEVKVSGGFELEFDKNCNFVRIDD